MTRVAVDGGTLFARQDGAHGSAPWLVLANGIATDHTMWDQQIPALTARYRVVRYDARGHGASDAPPGPYALEMLADDVARVLDHYGIVRASFMGLSLGGMTGLCLAVRHPERVDALVCANARADAPEPFAKSWDDRIAAIGAGGMSAIVDATIDRWLRPATRQACPELASRLQRMIVGTSRAGFEGCAAALKQLALLPHLGSIAIPTLYVAGANDLGAPPDVMQRMTDATPGARIGVIDPAAHMSNLDNPSGFLAAVGAFLGLDPAQADQGEKEEPC